MEPVGVTYDPGRGWLILYECQVCGAAISNRTAKDDNYDMVISLSQPDRQGMKATAFAAAKARTLRRLAEEIRESEPGAQESTAALGERKDRPENQVLLKLGRLLKGKEEFSLQDVIDIIRDCPEKGPGSADSWLTLFKMREFEPEETVMTLTALAYAAETPALFSRYMRAVHYRLQDIGSWPAKVDFGAIESRILDCLEKSLRFSDPRKPADSALGVLKRFSTAEGAAFSSIENNERAFDMLLGIAGDMPGAGFLLRALSLECLARILSKLDKDRLPASLKDRILNMLNNHSNIISHDIRMGLLLGLEYILKIETRSIIDKQRGEAARLNHNGELFIQQLDTAADVMVELQDRWEREIHIKPSDRVFDEMIASIEKERRLTPQQRVRFYMALIHLKTNSMVIGCHTGLLRKNSADECDPHKLLKNMTGVKLPGEIPVSVIYDYRTPFNVYFEFEDRKGYLAFERLYDKYSIGQDTAGNFKVAALASFGYKGGMGSVRRHETEHAFYQAIAETIGQQYGFESRKEKVDSLGSLFLEQMDKGEYQKARAAIDRIAGELIGALKDEFMAFFAEKERLSSHFEYYRDKFSIRSVTYEGGSERIGLIVRIKRRLKAIAEADKREELQNYLKAKLKRTKDTITDYEALAFRLTGLVGREKASALLYMLPFNRYHCLKGLCEYYKPLSFDKTDQYLDKLNTLTVGYLSTNHRLRVQRTGFDQAAEDIKSILARRGATEHGNFGSFDELDRAFRGSLDQRAYTRLKRLERRRMRLFDHIKNSSFKLVEISDDIIYNLALVLSNIGIPEEDLISGSLYPHIDTPFDSDEESRLRRQINRLFLLLKRVVEALGRQDNTDEEIFIADPVALAFDRFINASAVNGQDTAAEKELQTAKSSSAGAEQLMAAHAAQQAWAVIQQLRAFQTIDSAA